MFRSATVLSKAASYKRAIGQGSRSLAMDTLYDITYRDRVPTPTTVIFGAKNQMKSGIVAVCFRVDRLSR
jgi:hypothetical protein